MRALSFPHRDAADRVVEQLTEFVTAVRQLSDLQLLDPSLCRGWSVLDLVVHVRMGLQEMAVGMATRTREPADHDAASYWSSHPDDREEDPVPHILWLRRTASAYTRPVRAVTHLQEVADTTASAVRSMPEGTVEFQGKRMSSGDFLATWVVELAIHQLDVGLDGDTPSGAAWARKTVEAIAEADLPLDLDDRSAVLLGLGRVEAPRSGRLDAPFPVSL